MSKWIKFLAVLAILFFCIILFFVFQWLSFLNSPMIPRNESSIIYVVPKNISVRALANDLQKQDLLEKPTDFVLFAYLLGKTRDLQAGTYKIGAGTTPAQLLNKFVTGKVVLHEFTIIPGWTFKKMVQELEHNKYLLHNLQGLSADKIMITIGRPGELPEGRFFPDTYKFAAGSSDIDLLSAAYDLMQEKLTQEWKNRAVDLPYSCPYKVLIIASIIEKEASLPKELPIISGVVKNRLLKNMYLQLDPTLIYGLGDRFKGRLTDADLRQNTPYNTYRNKGLPPTPICMPSEAAINAVLHPAKTKYLYFVAKGDGSHLFSTTLVEHNLAVQKYLINNK